MGHDFHLRVGPSCLLPRDPEDLGTALCSMRWTVRTAGRTARKTDCVQPSGALACSVCAEYVAPVRPRPAGHKARVAA